jgi:hypothetical protein
VRLALVPLVLAAGCHDPMARSEASAAGSMTDEVIAPLQTTATPAPPASPCPTPPTPLGDGLTHERQPLGATPATAGEPCFDVVRADPARFRLRMITKDQDSSAPAPKWRERYKLAAVTNAGMFHANGAPVGLVINAGTVLSKDNTKYGGFLAFGPISPTDPAVVIGGRDCAGFDHSSLRARYRSILQSNRLVGCNGEGLTWKDPKQYSAAVVGLDRSGKLVFIHSRPAVTMSELAQAVSALGMTGALFLEGGPEASLVVRGDRGELARVGSYETGFIENDENQSFYWLPNVLALEAR